MIKLASIQQASKFQYTQINKNVQYINSMRGKTLSFQWIERKDFHQNTTAFHDKNNILGIKGS